MMNETAQLDKVLHAIADSTRRQVIERLCRGPATVSELAEPFAMAMPSFMQHLRVLEHSGLITSTKEGRIRTCRIEPKPLRKLESWLGKQRALWERRLDQLDSYLQHIPKDKT